MMTDVEDGNVVYCCDYCGDEFHTPIECHRHEEACKTWFYEEPD